MTAAEKILQRSLATSGLNAAQWNGVQAGLRDRAFFTSRVESARFLHAARTRIAEHAQGGMSPSEIRRDLRRILDHEGYAVEAGKEGTMEDLRSRQRLDMVIETNTSQARGYIQHVEANTPGALMGQPAQELVRNEQRGKPRDWTQRWKQAGGRLYAGRMIALKGAAVWTNISRFGTPWPPYDFGSGMGVESITREEALALGVVQPEDPPPTPAPVPSFNEHLETEVPFVGKDSPEWNWLKDVFGDQIIQKQGKIRWVNDVLRDAVLNPSATNQTIVRLGKSTPELLAKAPADIAEALQGKSIGLQTEWMRHLYEQGHIGDQPDDPRNIQLTPEDFDLISTLWRNPDSVQAGDNNDTAILKLDTYDEGELRLVLGNLRFGPRPLTFYKRRRP